MYAIEGDRVAARRGGNAGHGGGNWSRDGLGGDAEHGGGNRSGDWIVVA